MYFNPLQAIGLLLLGRAAVAFPAESASPSANILIQASNINITSAVFSGNGCPAGSLSTSKNSDGTGLAFGFDKMEAWIGPGYTLSEKTRNCAITLTLAVRSGYTFELVSTTYHARARLPAQVKGVISSQYAFNTANTASTTQSSPAGPLQGIYTQEEVIPKSARIASACGVEKMVLQISTRMTLTASSASASGGNIEGDPPLSLATQLLQLGWSACKK
ncbi:hypothetical protein B0H63DRAFT_19430 [Podospora didyma]|uniref:Secreted protein n=1 Tax=Podospora didyma TaxID=330526 RepID=A0AAE0P5B7_9PEZI|nr:hypothetical protein B0H63DRAFT_19430 [Podospora didyma]